MKRTKLHLALLGCFASGVMMTAPAFADTTQTLQDEIAAQRARLEDMEKELGALKQAQQQQSAATAKQLPANVVVGGDIPGSIKIPGTDTSLKLSGYIRLVAAKDLNEFLGSKFQAGNISPNGAPARNQSGNMFMTAKLSRLMFESYTPTSTAWGPIKTMLAIDAFGSEKKSDYAEGLQNNGFHLRIAHAYASYGPLLVGQTWSNFTDDPDSAETIDSSGPAGVPSERQAQVRLTYPAGPGAASFSFENPVGDGQLPGSASGSKYTSGLSDGVVNKMPDLTAKYEIDNKVGHAQISGIVRRFYYDDGAGHSASATGTGLILGGTLNMNQLSEGFGKDQFGGQVWTGNGIGKYIPDDFAQPSAFAINNPGTGQVSVTGQHIYGATVFYKHYWSPQWRSNLAFGYNHENFADFIVAASDQAKTLKTAHLNLIYSPYKNVDLATEVMYGRKSFRDSLGLADASASRVDFGAKVKF